MAGGKTEDRRRISDFGFKKNEIVKVRITAATEEVAEGEEVES
jgi:hypothetical protein